LAGRTKRNEYCPNHYRVAGTCLLSGHCHKPGGTIHRTEKAFARDIQGKILVHNAVQVFLSRTQHDDDLSVQIKNLKPAVVFIEECFYNRITPYFMGTLHDQYPKTRFAVFTYTEIEEQALASFMNSGASSFINFRLDPEECSN
jgi:hypothetical protein